MMYFPLILLFILGVLRSVVFYTSLFFAVGVVSLSGGVLVGVVDPVMGVSTGALGVVCRGSRGLSRRPPVRFR